MYNKKNNKQLKLRPYLIVLLIGILISFSFFLFCKNDRKINLVNFEKNSLSNISLKYTENGKYDIELLKTADKNLIYGTIFDSSKNGNLFLTKGIYTFDVSTNNFNYYENSEENRIVDFYVKDNVLYKVVLENTLNDNYYWKIVRQNLSNNNEEIIIKGYVVNIFNYPRILTYNNNIYAITVSNDGDKYSREIYSFFQLCTTSSNSAKELFSYSGSTLRDDGILNYNIANNKIYRDNFYYTIVDKDHIQYLIELDLNNLKKNVIKENKSNDKVLYSYIPTNNGIYIQFASKNIEEKSTIEYHFKNNDDVNILATEINTFENQINNRNLLFHNEGNKWILYNIEKNHLFTLNSNLENINLYPKYLVIDENKIMVQDFENNFYIGNVQT